MKLRPLDVVRVFNIFVISERRWTISQNQKCTYAYIIIWVDGWMETRNHIRWRTATKRGRAEEGQTIYEEK